MKHSKSVKLVGPLKEKCLRITVALGPFEIKAFTHYHCCWWPLWKQSNLLIGYITVAVGSLWTQGSLHIRPTIARESEASASLAFP